jgi:predicted nucleotidyltransferase
MKLTDIQPKNDEQEMALRNCIFFCRTGSQLYGTSTPESDDDFTGIFVPDRDYVIGKKKALTPAGNPSGDTLEQIEFNTNPSTSRKRNTKDDVDCMLFSLDKWTTMCANNNPNRLEVFFAPKNCILHMTELGGRLFAARDNFISLDSYNSFKGYSHEQMRRLKLKSGNNNGRQDLIEKYGYDVKMASHNIRLYMECIQLLKQGSIEFPLSESGFILDMKRGKVTYEEFIAKSEQLAALCDAVYANSKLPAHPNLDAINKLQISIYEDFWGAKYN